MLGKRMGEFLYIDPLKQGLKLHILSIIIGELIVFIHRSIKTRIETNMCHQTNKVCNCFYT